MREALEHIPLSIGWQLIHAYEAHEGNARRWANSSFGEPDQELTNWRESIVEHDSSNDTDSLVI